MDIYISILDPTKDIASTIPYFYDFYLPDTDISVTAYCQVYCGLGHSNMKLRFDIGDGEPNHGKQLFNVFIIFNAILAITFSYFLTSPIKRKVYLTKQALSPNQTTNSHLIKVNLYDISKLSEKELIALRQGYLDIEKVCYLLATFVDLSIAEVKIKVLSGEIAEDCDLIEF